MLPAHLFSLSILFFSIRSQSQFQHKISAQNFTAIAFTYFSVKIFINSTSFCDTPLKFFSLFNYFFITTLILLALSTIALDCFIPVLHIMPSCVLFLKYKDAIFKININKVFMNAQIQFL